KGKVLDIACGTGKTMTIISKFSAIEVFGCDISDFLISKAIERGIQSDHLVVCDASKTNYPENYFDYAYSIGSLEHFTEDGIINCLSECFRIVGGTSFHMIPVSRSGVDEGWMKTLQSFHNNSVQWWLDKYEKIYKTVYVLDSDWQDKISIGKWFVCIK
ncbi:MAG: class I SAM-dependent methyltransferase, partial [Nitrospira sp.]|nr:class I SAM-dependent methyltransferase [Nitrospira sp.]